MTETLAIRGKRRPSGPSSAARTAIRVLCALVVSGLVLTMAPLARARAAASSPSISINDVTVAEGSTGTGSAVFTVTLSSPASRTVTVRFATANGSATAPADYTATRGTLTINPNETAKQVVVQIVGDTAIESNETYSVTLSKPKGASIADGSAQGTVTDDDTPALPSLTINNMTVTEGNSGSQNAAFNVTLSASSAGTVTVDYATADGSATTPADYTAVSGTLTFAPGEVSKQIVVPVVGDTDIEANETYSVNLSNPTGAAIGGDGFGLGTINNNDTVSVSIGNATVTEGNGVTVNATFNVTLSASSAGTVTVDYATADGSATAPADYTAVSGTLTFAPGEVSKQIVVPVVSDTVIEVSETYSVDLSNPGSATIAGSGFGLGTINDNDTVSVSIGNVTVTEGNAGTLNAVFNVTLSAPSASTVTVSYTTANGSATAPADYIAVSGTLTFAPGEVSKQIIVQIVGDLVPEVNETYSVNLSNPTNATIAGSGFGLGTINNND